MDKAKWFGLFFLGIITTNMLMTYVTKPLLGNVMGVMIFAAFLTILAAEYVKKSVRRLHV